MDCTLFSEDRQGNCKKYFEKMGSTRDQSNHKNKLNNVYGYHLVSYILNTFY